MEKVSNAIPPIAAVDRLSDSLVVAFADGKELLVPASALYVLAEIQELGLKVAFESEIDEEE